MIEETQETSKSSPKLERDENGRLLPGQESLNPNGRPKGKTLKEYAREYFMLKTDEDKMAYINYIEEKKPGFAWSMAEGNPHQSNEHEFKGPLKVEFANTFNVPQSSSETGGDHTV